MLLGNINSKFYIYVHYRLTDNTPFYIGKGTNHRAFDCRPYERSKRWSYTANKHGWRAEILEYYETEKEAYEMEEYLIDMLLFCGYRLCNNARGGKGGMAGYKHSEETRRKNSISHMGKHQSIETRKKRSEKLKGISRPEHVKRKISETNKGKPFTEERKINISIGRKGKPAWNKGLPSKSKGMVLGPLSEEVKNKISISRKGKPAWNKGISTGPQDEKTKIKRAKSLIKGCVVGLNDANEVVLRFDSRNHARLCGYRVEIAVVSGKKKYGLIWKLIDNP